MPDTINTPPTESTESDFSHAFSEAQSAAAAAQPAATQTPETPPAAPPTQTAAAQPPPPQDPPAPPAAPAAPDPEPQQPSPLLQQAAQFGIEGESPEDIAAAALRQIQTMQPYATFGQTYLPQAEEIQQFLATKQQQQQAEPPSDDSDQFDPDSYFREQWDVPEWKPEYDHAINRGLVEQNENGMFVPVPGAEAMVTHLLPGLNQAHTAKREQWMSFMNGNPYQQIYERVLEPMQKQWQADMQQAFQQQFGQVQQEQSVKQFEDANANWLYDAQGQPTEQGQKFFEQISALQQAGVSDHQQLLDLGMKLAGINPQQPADPAQQQAATVPFQQQQQQAAAAPAQQPAAPQQKSFMDNALEQASHSPNAGGMPATAPENDPPVTSGELESMFVNSLQASQGKVSA